MKSNSKGTKVEHSNTPYYIYPCDLDPFGECPKGVADCSNCCACFEHTFEDEDAQGVEQEA